MNRTDRLTPREKEVLTLIASHLSSKEAARQAGISSKRVDKIVASAAQKMGVPDRRAAVRVLIEEGGEVPPGAPLPVPGSPQMSDLEDVSEDDCPATAYAPAPAPEQDVSSAGQHAERRVSLGPDLGRPGTGADADRLPGEPASRAIVRDGALERQLLPAGEHLPSWEPRSIQGADGLDPPIGAGLLPWIRGRARFSELSPLARVGAVLLLSAGIVAVVSWTLTGSLQATLALHGWLPAHWHVEGRPWILLERPR